MNIVLDLLSSVVFWTAVGSVATIFAILIGILQHRHRRRRERDESVARDIYLELYPSLSAFADHNIGYGIEMPISIS